MSNRLESKEPAPVLGDGLRPSRKHRPKVSNLRILPCQTVDQEFEQGKYNLGMEHYRIVADVGLYYVTFTVIEWLPVFIEETACKIITESLNFCIQKKHLGVNAYVVMPTHVHAIVFDVEFNS